MTPPIAIIMYCKDLRKACQGYETPPCNGLNSRCAADRSGSKIVLWNIDPRDPEAVNWNGNGRGRTFFCGALDALIDDYPEFQHMSCLGWGNTIEDSEVRMQDAAIEQIIETGVIMVTSLSEARILLQKLEIAPMDWTQVLWKL